jgi:hypothetical protein
MLPGSRAGRASSVPSSWHCAGSNRVAAPGHQSCRLAHAPSRSRSSGVSPCSVRGVRIRGSNPRVRRLRRTAAGRSPTRWSSHHARALTSGWHSSHASRAANFHHPRSDICSPVGSGTAGQSRPGKGCKLERISALQLDNHTQDTPATWLSSSSRAHSVGETITGPETSPATTSSPQGVPAPPTGETTPSTSRITTLAPPAVLLTSLVWHSGGTGSPQRPACSAVPRPRPGPVDGTGMTNCAQSDGGTLDTMR